MAIGEPLAIGNLSKSVIRRRELEPRFPPFRFEHEIERLIDVPFRRHPDGEVAEASS